MSVDHPGHSDDRNDDRNDDPAAASPYRTPPGRTIARTTFQLAADVPAPLGSTADETLARVTATVVDRLGAGFAEPLPAAAHALESFDLGDGRGERHLRVLSMANDGLWSARLVHLDDRINGDAAASALTHTTDIALHRGTASVRVGVRALSASASRYGAPVRRARPEIVDEVARSHGLQEIRALDGRPWMLATELDLDALFELVTDPRRTLPVVLLTYVNPRHALPGVVREFLLDHEQLAADALGLGHVVCMPDGLSHAWTHHVGKVWSAFRGAIRTYFPNVDFEDGDPFAHPRILPDRVAVWSYDGMQGERAFAAFVVDRLLEHAATKSADWDGCRFYPDLRSHLASLRRQSLRADVEGDGTAVAGAKGAPVELERAHAEEVEALHERLAEAKKDAEEFDALASSYRDDVERLQRELQRLQEQNDNLRSSLRAATGRSADAYLEMPTDYEDLPDWVENHLSGRLVLHPRALKGVKNAVYTDVSLVYQALILLAGTYRDMALGLLDARAWERGYQRLGLRFGPSITKSRAGEKGDTYYLRYPPGSENRRFLEYHLRKGSAKDDRYCLGIYFFWDAETQKVVVGWLPSHLDTRAT